MRAVYSILLLLGSAFGQGGMMPGPGTPNGGGGAIPTDIANLVWWFKADSIVSCTGAAISSWTDSSGNSHTATQATGVNQPSCVANVIGTKPAVYSDASGGNQQYLGIASPTGVTAGTIFVVWKAVAPNLAIVASGSDLNSFSMQVSAVGSAGDVKITKPAGPDIAANTHGLSVGSAYIEDVTWNASTYAFRLLQSGTWVADGSGSAATTATANIDKLFNGLGLNTWQLQLAEVFLYSRILNGTEIGQMESYLKTKYGL